MVQHDVWQTEVMLLHPTDAKQSHDYGMGRPSSGGVWHGVWERCPGGGWWSSGMQSYSWGIFLFPILLSISVYYSGSIALDLCPVSSSSLFQFFQNLPSFPYPFSNFLSSRSYPQPVMADRQMAGSRALDLPVRTAGGFPLTLKQRVAFVSPTVTWAPWGPLTGSMENSN